MEFKGLQGHHTKKSGNLTHSQPENLLHNFFISDLSLVLIVFDCTKPLRDSRLRSWIELTNGNDVDILLVGTHAPTGVELEKSVKVLSPVFTKIREKIPAVKNVALLDTKTETGLPQLRNVLHSMGQAVLDRVLEKEKALSPLCRRLKDVVEEHLQKRRYTALRLRTFFVEITQNGQNSVNQEDILTCIRFFHSTGRLIFIDRERLSTDPYAAEKSVSINEKLRSSSWISFDRLWLGDVWMSLVRFYLQKTDITQPGMLYVSEVTAAWKSEQMFPPASFKPLLTYMEDRGMIITITSSKKKIIIFNDDKDSTPPKQAATKSTKSKMKSSLRVHKMRRMRSRRKGNVSAEKSKAKIDQQRELFFAKHPQLSQTKAGRNFKVAFRNEGSFEREMLNNPKPEEDILDLGFEKNKVLVPSLLPSHQTEEAIVAAGWNPGGLCQTSGAPSPTKSTGPSWKVASLGTSWKLVGKRRFAFERMPSSFFNRILVRFLDSFTVKLYWQNTLIVEQNSTFARVDAVIEDDYVEVQIYGNYPAALWHGVGFHLADVASFHFGLHPKVTVSCTHCIERHTPKPFQFRWGNCEVASGLGGSKLYCSHASNDEPVLVNLHSLVPDLMRFRLCTKEVAYDDLEMTGQVLQKGERTIVQLANLKENGVVVVKELVTDLQQDIQHRSLEEIRVEASILAQLDHPNIVKQIGISIQTVGKGFAIVMEYLQKGSLLQLLRSGVVDSWQLRVSLAEDIALGIEYLHSQRPAIVHRDLKSANVFVTNDNVAKIGDFGTAAQSAYKVGKREVDNPFWLAPEVMRGEEYTPKSDVYSYGIVMWELAMQRIPFEEYNPGFLSVLEKQIIAGLRPTYDCNESCPDGFHTLMRVCWDNDWHQRPSSVSVIQKLQEVKENIKNGVRCTSDKLSLIHISEPTRPY
eukprot:TRINITY_DN6903_c0_g1_i3.p1 TRINITY_DN6903_c0_g1~~TRINITY_DN6903_c0_g1_i3.p1  ORF type:complete len:917 (+),score=143.65 TRINITY_DN6903_c0_g1_i3:288-3038(+)